MLWALLLPFFGLGSGKQELSRFCIGKRACPSIQIENQGNLSKTGKHAIGIHVTLFNLEFTEN